MKAIQLHQYGGTDVLLMEEVSKPVPQENDILIRIKAAALNPIDSKIRSGSMQQIIPLPLPFTPGWESAGVVESVGTGVTRFKSGDEVIARVPFAKAGAYAEYMLAGEREIVRKPASLSFAEASSLPIVGSAAYTLLFKAGHLQAGQTVFILGAGGSVGLLTVQLAKQAGAVVIGTATGEDRNVVLKAGADEVLDYANPDYAKQVHDVDLALDLVGGSAQEALWPLLRKGGLLLSTTMPPAPDKAAKWGVAASFIFTQPDQLVMEKVAELAGKRSLQIHIGKTLPLTDVGQAHFLMDQGQVKGKIVLEMN
jgi:NADPH:quinone reductase-like Zn-dependent oxidoreductase